MSIQLRCLTYEEIEKQIKEHELPAKVHFVKQGSSKSFGQPVDENRIRQKSIQWQERGSTDSGIQFNGIPYLVIGRQLLECSHGPTRNINPRKKQDDHVYGNKKYTMVQMTKKLGCEAKIVIREILCFPKFKINDDRKWLKRQAGSQLKNHLSDSIETILRDSEHAYVATISTVHSQHYIGPLSETSLSLDDRVMNRMKELAQGGVLQLPEMKRRLAEFVQSELFPNSANKPTNFDGRFWPSNKTILNCLYRTKVAGRLADADDSNLLAHISQWQSHGCTDNFHVNAGDDDSCVIFVHQSKWQQALLGTYGNDVVLVDSTFNTTRYQLPLLVLAVPTSVGFYPVAFALLPRENRQAISSVLSVLQQWNPDWNPQCFMTDFNEGQLLALELHSPGSVVLLCDFHRIQTWRRRTGKLSCRQEILKMMEAVAKSNTEDDCSSALHRLFLSPKFQSSKLRSWFERRWLPHLKRWVKCYRGSILHTRVTTNNGLERLHQTLKYGYLADAASGTVTNLVTVLSQKFLPDMEKKYQETNVGCLNTIRLYNESVPQFLLNRPRPFVVHCFKRLPPAIEEIKLTDIVPSNEPECFTVSSNGKSYTVNLNSSDATPKCQCPDWKKFSWPCKHILAIIINVDGYEWDQLPQKYRELPQFNLDPIFQKASQSKSAQLDSQTASSPAIKHVHFQDEVEALRVEVRELAEQIKTNSYDMREPEVLKATRDSLNAVLGIAQRDQPSVGFRRFKRRNSRTNVKRYGKRSALYRCSGQRIWKKSAKRRRWRQHVVADLITVIPHSEEQTNDSTEQSLRSTQDMIGLANLGNTCFVNAVVQVLRRIDSISQCIYLHAEQHNSTDCESCCLASCFQGSPSHLHRILNKVIMPSYRPGQQRDAHEFLTGLLNAISLNSRHDQNLAVVQTSLSSTISHTVVCRICKLGRARKEIHNIIMVPLPSETGETDLQAALNESHFAEELTRQCPMSRCRSVSAVAYTDWSICPQVLGIQMKRWTNETDEKSLESIIPNEILIIKSSRSNVDTKYILVGIVVHAGRTIDTGHYFALTKSGSIWYRCDDSKITVFDFNHGYISEAKEWYLAFYIKENAAEGDVADHEVLTNYQTQDETTTRPLEANVPDTNQTGSNSTSVTGDEEPTKESPVSEIFSNTVAFCANPTAPSWYSVEDYTSHLPNEILCIIVKYAVHNDLVTRQKLAVVNSRFNQLVQTIPQMEVYLNPSVETAYKAIRTRYLSMKRLKDIAGPNSGLVQAISRGLPAKKRHLVWMDLDIINAMRRPGWYNVRRVFWRSGV